MSAPAVPTSAGRRAIVVGAGAIGVCSAWYLAQAGFKVTVLERGAVGEGCSWGNAGLVVPSHSIPLAAPGVWQRGLAWMLLPNSPFRVKPRLDPSLLRWLWAFRGACTEAHVERSVPVLRELSYASRALWVELAALPGFDFGFRQAGMLAVFRTARGYEEGQREAALLLRHGVENSVLSAKATLAAEPALLPGVAGALFFPHDAQLEPHRFVKGLAERASQRGVEFRPFSEVVGFEAAGGRVAAVHTARERLAADELVLAAGSASARLGSRLGLRLPVEAGKGYSVTVDRPAERPRVPLLLAEDRLAVTPMGSRLRLSGTLELSGEDRSVRRKRALTLLGATRRWFTDPVRVGEQTEIWSGLRPCTPDGLPLVGRSPRHVNVIVATGHGMLGVSLAPVTGRLVADLAASPGEKPPLDALRVERFDG